MKIIHVLSGLTKGGGERVVVELANQSAANGDEVTILAGWPEDPVYLQNMVHPDVEVRFISSGKSYRYFKTIPWIFVNRKWICSNDILHCHLTFGVYFGSVVNGLLKKILRNKKPVIVETNHSVGMAVPKFNRWVHSRMALQCAGVAFMATDPYWADFMLKHPRLKTEIIPNGISVLKVNNDSAQTQQLLNGAGIPEDYKYLVGSISMLRPDRKPWLYVPLFEEIYKTLGNKVHFVLGGSGEEIDKIIKLIKEKDLSENFHLIGLVNEPTHIISLIDVYVSISVGETSGISMIEAAMSNVPVVGIQLVDGYKAKESDWVWSDTDISEVAKKIIELLSNTEQRNKLKETQREYVTKHFTSDAMYSSFNLFYKRVLSS